jgi:hypothetical protein
MVSVVCGAIVLALIRPVKKALVVALVLVIVLLH